MRVGDNLFNLYGQSQPLQKTRSVVETVPAEASKPPQQSAVVPDTRQVSPVAEGERQQLLQAYLQNQGVSRELPTGYRQQQAVAAYSQQSGQDERVQLQEILGIDEYV